MFRPFRTKRPLFINKIEDVNTIGGFIFPIE